ncbi:MAG: NAD(P)-dependent dehydrogenase (short-subunit alcohol dehydrogenase family) [Rhodothermales bacterium]|jgi:NAD(P)-dependent dehydrogenase (short-subunit alcohol dehydrogenase family)
MPRHILITGAAHRLGREIALSFAEPGARIAVHHHSSDPSDTLCELRKRGAEAEAFQADLRSPQDVEQLIADSADFLGEMDSLVASAAVFRRTPWQDVSEDDWDFHMQGNLKATFLLLRAAAPRMADGGAIVTIADWSGLRPYRDYLPYCVSKAGVIALSQALAQEVAPRVRVNCICPGTVLPPENADAAKLAKIANATPLGRIGSPADIANAVHFLIEGTSFATGSVLAIDGGRLIANQGLY